MARLRFVLYITLSIFAFLGVERLCHMATDGFSIARISHPIAAPETAEESPFQQLDELLSQPFTYLASGAQSYVFASQDGNYVMKFFKFHHLRIPPWLSYIPLPSPLQRYREHKIAKKEQLLQNTLQSYEIAKALMPQATALVYLHLYPTHHLHQKVHLIDKIGIHYVLDADPMIFAIQKRATPLYGGLEGYIKQGHISQAKIVLSNLLQLSLERCQQGIKDIDPDFQTNFGLIDEVVVQLDVGRFSMDLREKNPEVYREELYRITRPLSQWLSQHSQPLALYLEQELENLQQGDSLL